MKPALADADLQTARLIEACAPRHERLGGTTTQGSWRWLRRAQALDAALADK
jgi:hypothetical protein